MQTTIRFIPAAEHAEPVDGNGAVALDNSAGPRTLSLEGIARIDLHFPKFTDGRAYSQAFLLRRRLGFTGEIRATGEVLVDQLVQLQRSGFDSAVLPHDTDAAAIARQFARFPEFYQGDAVTPFPRFARPPVVRRDQGQSALPQPIRFAG